MTFELYHGDCVELMRSWPENSVDAIVTDGPYELTQAKRTKPPPYGAGPFSRHRVGVNGDNSPVGGFMGKEWDGTGVVFDPETWRAALRLLKPGGHLLSFGGTRTYHRMACAIEDAGFEIRDSIDWFYGSGFPKSQDAAREFDMHVCTLSGQHCDKNYPKNRKPEDHLCPPALGREQYVGRRTALKGAHEPIVLARKPMVGTLIENLVQFGTGALNVDVCRIGPRWPANVILDEDAAAELDRNSPQVGAKAPVTGDEESEAVEEDGITNPRGRVPGAFHGDSGGASRFFYVAKPGRSEKDAGCDHLMFKSAGEVTDREDGSAGLQSPRAGAGRTSGARNGHPTVKPINLMRYLCRLITPPGGIVLDPFMGSGTTGVAALKEGFDFLGTEREFEYLTIANARIIHHQGVP